MTALTIFEKKLKILKGVSVSDNLNFGRLFNSGVLSVKTLEVCDEGSFPYPPWGTKEADKHNLLIEHLKINWEEYKDSKGYGISNAWSTYRGCTSVNLMYGGKGAIHLKVTVYNGDSLSGYQKDKRFTVLFIVEDLSIIRKAYKESVDNALYSYAKELRRKEIQQEERDKIESISAKLLASI